MLVLLSVLSYVALVVLGDIHSNYLSPGLLVLLSVLSYVVLVVLGDTRSNFLSWLIHVASRLLCFRAPCYIYFLITILCVPDSSPDTMTVAC